MTVIPREGVERHNSLWMPVRVTVKVIPREGVESELLNHLNAVVAEVIPREGVES